MPSDAWWLGGKQFGNADQVIGDQIELEVGGDASEAPVLVLRMVPCCLPHPKMHSTIARRDCNMPYPGCRVVRWSMALLRFLPVLVTAWFCVTCGVMPGAEIGDVIGRIVRLVLTGRDAAACGFASRLQHGLLSPAFGGAIGMRDLPATASPCQAWPI